MAQSQSSVNFCTPFPVSSSLSSLTWLQNLCKVQQLFGSQQSTRKPNQKPLVRQASGPPVFFAVEECSHVDRMPFTRMLICQAAHPSYCNVMWYDRITCNHSLSTLIFSMYPTDVDINIEILPLIMFAEGFRIFRPSLNGIVMSVAPMIAGRSNHLLLAACTFVGPCTPCVQF